MRLMIWMHINETIRSMKSCKRINSRHSIISSSNEYKIRLGAIKCIVHLVLGKEESEIYTVWAQCTYFLLLFLFSFYFGDMLRKHLTCLMPNPTTRQTIWSRNFFTRPLTFALKWAHRKQNMWKQKSHLKIADKCIKSVIYGHINFYITTHSEFENELGVCVCVSSVAIAKYFMNLFSSTA